MCVISNTSTRARCASSLRPRCVNTSNNVGRSAKSDPSSALAPARPNSPQTARGWPCRSPPMNPTALPAGELVAGEAVRGWRIGTVLLLHLRLLEFGPALGDDHGIHRQFL